MIAVFKRKNGWMREIELPFPKRLPQVYELPEFQEFVNWESSDPDDIAKSVKILRFVLDDFWQNKNGVNVRAFYEEI